MRNCPHCGNAPVTKTSYGDNINILVRCTNNFCDLSRNWHSPLVWNLMKPSVPNPWAGAGNYRLVRFNNGTRIFEVHVAYMLHDLSGRKVMRSWCGRSGGLFSYVNRITQETYRDSCRDCAALMLAYLNQQREIRH